MGLGTKIKEALSSDKGHQYSASQQRRVAPGAYPDSIVDVPRSASTKTRTWDATDTYSKKKHPSSATKDHNHATENDEPGEYTFSPVKEREDQQESNDITSGHNDETELIPSPDSRIAGNHHNKTAFSKNGNLEQHPYWGDLGKTGARDDADMLDGKTATNPFDNNDQVAFLADDTENTINGHSLGRNGTINNGNYSTRRGQANAHEYDDDEKFGAPIIATVNHGQPHLAADSEEARIASMAASQLSQPTEYDGHHIPVGLSNRNTAPDHGNTSYDNTNYGMNYPATAAIYDDKTNYGVKRTPTVNGRGPSPTNARGTFGSPQEFSNNIQGNTTYQAGNRFPEQQIMEREQNGSVGSSSNGISSPTASKSAAADHYGPGHSGAKVLHRCEHCGNDNDITKYFSKDVVYRLS